MSSQRVLWYNAPPKQFLKWIGNKQRFAGQIAGYAPDDFERYIEPFVGSGALLGTIAPQCGLAGDIHRPLIELWNLLQEKPKELLEHYSKLWYSFLESRDETYERVKASYNADPNPCDLLFLCRSCYGGVVRFRRDGYMSTPVGPHRPISPESLRERTAHWRRRIRSTRFVTAHFAQLMASAKRNDLIYCDPPYTHSQSILYGAQSFRLPELWESVQRCRKVGAKVMVSIVGKKKSGRFVADLAIPRGLFEREVLINCGRSMLRRFQRPGETLEDEVVHDRLLLTW